MDEEKHIGNKKAVAEAVTKYYSRGRQRDGGSIFQGRCMMDVTEIAEPRGSTSPFFLLVLQ